MNNDIGINEIFCLTLPDHLVLTTDSKCNSNFIVIG